MHRSYELQGSLKRRRTHPHPTSINGYYTVKNGLGAIVYKWPTFAFTDEIGYTLGFAQKITHELTRRNRGCFGWGRYYYPRSVSHVHKHPRAGYQNGKLCRFQALVGGSPGKRREPAGQRCAYARRCPAGVAAPLGCVIFSLLPKLRLVHPALSAFRMCETRGGITTLGALRVLLKHSAPACQSDSFVVF